MKLNTAIGVIEKELKTDPWYRETWKANIAMAFKDCYSQYKSVNSKTALNNQDVHIISNSAAEFFIRLLTHDRKNVNPKADGIVALNLDIAEIIKEHSKQN